MKGVVVIGGSYAGVQAALTARELGYSKGITILSDEPVVSYQRPPLSKGFIVESVDEKALVLRPESYFAERGIDLLLGRRAARIDNAGSSIVLDDGSELRCERVVIATGSRARGLPVASDDAEILYLRSLADARHLRARLAETNELIVIGGGFIGLEVAASARKLGKRVVVLEAAHRLIERALSPPLSEFILELHRSNGVEVRLGTTVESITRRGVKNEVRCSDGDLLACDLVLVGIGGVPNSEIASDAGIQCGNGIMVDDVGRTSSPFALAAGDCANFYSPFVHRRMRLESVQHAQDQAKVVGACIAGRHEPYVSVPRFWSDQFNSKLQMVGLSEGHQTHAIRGSMDHGKFSVFLFRNEKLAGVDSVNRPGDQLIARKLIAAGVSPTPDQAADDSFDLKTLLSEAA